MATGDEQEKSDGASPSSALIRATVSVASLVTLLLELTATRVLSFIFFNHVVYLTVSLALLGFGIAGTLVAIQSSRRALFTRGILAALWVGLGLSIAVALGATSILLPMLGAARAKLFLCYGLYTVPFVFAGAILSIVLSSAPQRVGALYAFDLIAAGVGCLLFFLLLPAFGAPALMVLLVALALTMATLWAPLARRRGVVAAGVLAAGAWLLFLLMLGRTDVLDFKPEHYKAMDSHLQDPQAQIVKTTWTPLCRIDTVYKGPVPPHGTPGHDDRTYLAINQDADAPTWLFSAHGFDDRRASIADGNPEISANLVYSIKKNPDVAIIGIGGGVDIVYALASGARSVTAIELNPATYKLLTTDFADFDGRVVYDPRVTFLNGEGRATLRSLPGQFDDIQLIGIDTFAALSSGAYVLSENYLYTVEAFNEMFDRLKDDGVLLYQRWMFDPPRETLRLSSIACEAWKRRGFTDCEKRIMVLGGGEATALGNTRGWWASSLFKKTPFTQDEVKILTERVRRLNKNFVVFFPKLLPPDQQQSFETEYYARENTDHIRAPADIGALTSAYRNGTEKQFFASYEDNVTPTTDDSPFFFEYHRLNAFGLPSVDDLRGTSVSATLYLILIEATVLLAVAVFWPLFRYQRAGLKVAGAGKFTLYFAAIGIGFMLVEIALVQKCVLFLGNPLYSLPVVLATLLIAAGLGSRRTGLQKWGTRDAAFRAGIPLLGLLLVAAVALTPSFRALLFLSFPVRVMGVILVTIPFGFFMGAFFPSGLQVIRDEAKGFVPWAWGINGCASVYASIFAILIALMAGFNASLLLGFAMYVAACALGVSIERSLKPKSVTESA